MNKIETTKLKQIIVCAPGDIFQTDDGDTYIIAELPYPSNIVKFPKYTDMYVAVNLETGYAWTNPQVLIKDAVNGLKFFGRNLKIQISDGNS